MHVVVVLQYLNKRIERLRIHTRNAVLPWINAFLKSNMLTFTQAMQNSLRSLFFFLSYWSRGTSGNELDDHDKKQRQVTTETNLQGIDPHTVYGKT
jgi:hypothetical protein